MAEQHRNAQPDRRPYGNQWPVSGQARPAGSPGTPSGPTPQGGGTPNGSTPDGTTPYGKTPSNGMRPPSGTRPPGWSAPSDGAQPPGWMTPSDGARPPGWMMPPGGPWDTPGMICKISGMGWPGMGWQTPGMTGKMPPGMGWQTPGMTGKMPPGMGWQTPGTGGKMPPGMGWQTPGMGSKMPMPQMWAPALRHLEAACPLMSTMMSLVTDALTDETVQNLPSMRTFSEAFGAYVQANMAAAGTLRRLMQGEMTPELMGLLQDQLAALQPAAQELMTDWQELSRNQTARRSSAVRAMAGLMEMIWQHYQQLMTAIQPLLMWGRAMQ